MKKIILLFFLFIPFSINADSKQPVEFVRCVDGDTAIFRENGEEYKYRFLAIDTPESVKPDTEVQEYGEESKIYTCSLLENAKDIMVEYDNFDKEDKYGRRLVWVFVDDELLQALLVADGYAEVSYVYDNYKYVNDLCYLQKIAIESKEGIWSTDRKEGYCSTIDISDAEFSLDDLEKLRELEKSTATIGNLSNGISDLFSNPKFITVIIIILFIIETIRRIPKYLKK